MIEVYCGPAPTPQTFAGAWNFDLVAITLIGGIVALHLVRGDASRRLALAGGTVVLALLFLSPLCALSAALFSARAVHHVLLVAVAAPLLALAFPAGAGRRIGGLGLVVALHAGAFWFWHAPPVYAFALVHPPAYWLMQLTLLGSGIWLWRRVLDPRQAAGGAILALLGTTVLMGLLGALLTFAPQALYVPHFLTTQPFGLAPVEDQQLAGLIMWVPAALPYLAAALYRLWPLLGSPRPSGSTQWSG